MSVSGRESICFISPFMGPLLAKGVSCGTGGAERQFYLFGTELAKRGWRVVFIADCPAPSDTLPENVQVVHVPFKHIGGRKHHMLCELPRLFFALRRARTRFYAIKTAPHLAGVVCAYKALFPCGLIMWGQTSTSFDRVVANEPGWLRWIRWWGIRTSAALIAQTSEQAERAQREFEKRAYIVPNITVPPTCLQPAAEEKGYVFWCGNHSPNKRAEVFLELARLLPERRLVMAMNGEERAERYQEIKRDAQQIGNLRFLGSVPSADIDAWFAGAGVYLNTSIREGFPNTFLQAWQQGCPVVSVAIDPERNLGAAKLGHCLYRDEQHLRETAGALAHQLCPVVTSLLDKPEVLADFAVSSRDYVERIHSERVVIERFVDVMRGVEHGLA